MRTQLEELPDLPDFARLDYVSHKLRVNDFEGRVLAIIGRSHRGPVLNPVHVERYEHALEVFGHSELATAFREADVVGAEFVYLIRSDHSTSSQHYHNLRRVYDMLELMDVDIVLPLGVDLNDYAVCYPDPEEPAIFDFELIARKNGVVVDRKEMSTEIDIWQFSHWEQDLSGTEPEKTFEITDDMDVRAVFTLAEGQLTEDPAYSFLDELQLDKRYMFDFRCDTLEALIDPGTTPDSGYDGVEYCAEHGIMPETVDECYASRAMFYTRPINVGQLTEGRGRLKRFFLELDGRYDLWNRMHTFKIAYQTDGGRFRELPLAKVVGEESIELDPDVQELVLRVKFINDNNVQSPTIERMRLEVEYTLPDYRMRYSISHDYPYMKIWTLPDGSDVIHYRIDLEEYMEEHTEIEYFAPQLARACQRCRAVGILSAPDIRDTDSEERYNTLSTAVREIRPKLSGQEVDYGKFLAVPVQSFYYGVGGTEYCEKTPTAFAGLVGSLGPDESPTYKTLDRVNGPVPAIDLDEAGELAALGYTPFINSVRHGIVPYSTPSLARADIEATYHGLDGIRVMNTVVKRVEGVCDEYIGGSVYTELAQFERDVNSTLAGCVDDGLLVDHTFEIKEFTGDRIEVALDVRAVHETGDLYASAVAEI